MADINIAKQIVEAVGGEDNVKTLTHCMTRLRFTLKNEGKADDAAAKKSLWYRGFPNRRASTS